MFGLLPFVFALYVYRLPAQSEHMLDPHCLYSPVAGLSLAISSLFVFLFFLGVFFSPPACARESRRFFLFFCRFNFIYVTLFLFMFVLLLRFFVLYVLGIGLNLSEQL